MIFFKYQEAARESTIVVLKIPEAKFVSKPQHNYGGIFGYNNLKTIQYSPLII